MSSSRLRQASLNKNFNPRLIFSQIVAMQCFHYLFLGLFFQINHVLYGESITIDRMFTDKYIKIFHMNGWPDTFAVFLSYAAVGYVRIIHPNKQKKKPNLGPEGTIPYHHNSSPPHHNIVIATILHSTHHHSYFMMLYVLSYDVLCSSNFPLLSTNLSHYVSPGPS
jgi:hypothetical protein